MPKNRKNSKKRPWTIYFDKAMVRAEKAQKKEEEENKLSVERQKEEARYKMEESEKLKQQLEKEKQELLNSKDPFNHNLYFQKNKCAPESIKAFLVSNVDFPQYIYVAFCETRERARAESISYVIRNFYPFTAYDKCPVKFAKARAKRLPDFDKYRDTKRIPVLELLKAGFELPCSICGKQKFNYGDYVARRCFIVEGEGNANEYTDGLLACSYCYNQL